MTVERRPDESDIQYHKRLVYGKLVDKTLADYDYSELAPYVYGQEYSADVARRLMYGSRYTLELMDAEREHAASDNAPNVADELRIKKEELQKERMKLQTAKAEYAKWLREDARDEMFMEQVMDAIREHVGERTEIEPIFMDHGEREGVLCIADCHFGKEHKVHGLFDEVINEYSPEIFYNRMDRLMGCVIETVNKEGLTTLHVHNLGDSIEGLLRFSQLATLRYGAVDSAIIFGNYMGDWLRELSRHVIVIYGQTDGNHDEFRLLDGKKGQHLNESAGKIVRNCIRLKNEDNPNFEMIENRTGLIYDNVAGSCILGVHGEIKDVAHAIREFETIYDATIHYVETGHMHTDAYKNCGVRKGCIGVGSIVGVDDYSMQLRRIADATATLYICESGKGKTVQYTYTLN